MHRFVFAALAALPLALVLAAPADAQNRYGRWCAGQGVSTDHWTEDCHYRSLAQCRREVVAGNRGNCYQNPYRAFAGPKKYRRAHRSYR
jgi:hypothetical protein